MEYKINAQIINNILALLQNPSGLNTVDKFNIMNILRNLEQIQPQTNKEKASDSKKVSKQIN